MKTAKDWFDDYAISHQHPTNQLVHYICVPLIFFSVIGLLMSIPSEPLENIFGLYNPLIENWAMVVTFFISIFYLRMGFWYFLQMLFFILLAIGGNFWLGNNVNLLLASAIIFIAAWVGQFWGHQIEGQKPSFLKDLQFLLIGPLWVVKKLS
ncbi:MAG: DUF962 domain-containing protein [Flavobacteriaceae bacterium]|nr:DUF962 domain-containing protein [Flavobacteriaceae bacterium]